MDSYACLQEQLHQLSECSTNVLITATPPTPNGDLHLGHLSGPYLRADAYARFIRSKGHRVFYLTGIDDHQSYVPLKGEQINKSPEQTASDYGRTMISTLQKAQIEPDWIGQPRQSKAHQKMTLDMLYRLWDRGELVCKDTPAQFCDHCQEFIFEAYISGECPHCGSQSGGNACEVCGRPNDCADLRNCTCRRCGSIPSIRNYKRLYFPLSRHSDFLSQYWDSVHMGGHLRSLCRRMLAAGLPDIAITHISNWGLPVPIPEFRSQTIYVWFEMVAGYLAGATEMLDAAGCGDTSDRPWISDRWDIVQFFGYDNGYFHAVLFPAVLRCFDKTCRLTTAFISNEFYRLDGKKFSTSRNHAVWGNTFLEEIPPDIVRLYLAYTGPETEQTNFTHAGLIEFISQELSGRWNYWLRDVTAAALNKCAGKTPIAGTWLADHISFNGQIGSFVTRAQTAYSARTFSLQDAAYLLCDFVRISHRFFKAEAHLWELEMEDGPRRTGIALQLTAVRTLAIISAPLMPSFSKWIWERLGHSQDRTIAPWSSAGDMIEPGLTVYRLEFPPFEQWK